jgi:nicotinamidase-related amidase
MTTPIPSFFDPARVGDVWKVDYATRADDAQKYALQHNLKPAAASTERISLWVVDAQNTFCIPGYELFVGGRSGRGAVEDNVRLCEFIYRNIDKLSHITATMDTHTAHQIFHPIFFVDAEGHHPAPYSDIHVADLQSGKWTFNPSLAPHFRHRPRIRPADDDPLC